MGTACVAGCGDIKFAEDGKSFTLGGKTVQEGDYISLDGSTGKIYLGEIRTVPASISGNFDRIMTWADEIRTLLGKNKCRYTCRCIECSEIRSTGYWTLPYRAYVL